MLSTTTTTIMLPASGELCIRTIIIYILNIPFYHYFYREVKLDVQGRATLEEEQLL